MLTRQLQTVLRPGLWLARILIGGLLLGSAIACAEPLSQSAGADLTTPTPSPPAELVERVRQDLANRLSIGPDLIRLVKVEAVDWSDSSLGCPAAGSFYLQVITPGYRMGLEVQGQSYEYHTDLNGKLVLCQNGQPAAAVASPEPIVQIAWQQAEELILAAQVREVVQLHSLEVRLTLLDGAVLWTTEPAIDQVLQTIRSCGAPCSGISVATE
jgi:hypothetical protein